MKKIFKPGRVIVLLTGKDLSMTSKAIVPGIMTLLPLKKYEES